jgi:hypothetical protein
MITEDFETKYHLKEVKFESPTFTITGLCTAATITSNEYVIGIMAPGYEMGKTPEKWVTFKCPLDDESFNNWIKDFTILGDGVELENWNGMFNAVKTLLHKKTEI